MNEDPWGRRISSKDGDDSYYNKGLEHFARGVISGGLYHTKDYMDHGGRNWWRNNIYNKVLELIGKSNNLIKKLEQTTNEIIAGMHDTMFRLDFVKNNAVENIFKEVIQMENPPLSEEEKNFLLNRWKSVWDESFSRGVEEVIKLELEEILSSNETWNVMKLLGDKPKKNIEKRASERLNTLLKNIFSAGGREVFKMEEEGFIKIVSDDFRQSWIKKYIDKVEYVTQWFAYIIDKLKEKMTAQNFTWEPLKDDKMVEVADSMLTEFVRNIPDFQGKSELQENWIKVVAPDWRKVFKHEYNEMVRVRGNIKSGVEAQLEAQREAAEKAAKEQELKRRREEAMKRQQQLDDAEAAYRAKTWQENEERRAREEAEKEAKRQEAAMKAQAEKDKKDRKNAAQKQEDAAIEYIKNGLLKAVRSHYPSRIMEWAKIFYNGTSATTYELGMDDELEKIFHKHLPDLISTSWDPESPTLTPETLLEEVRKFSTKEVLNAWKEHYVNAVKKEVDKLRMKSPLQIEAEERAKREEEIEKQRSSDYARVAKEAAALEPGLGAPHGYSVFTRKPLPKSRRQIWDERAADERAREDNIARGDPNWHSDYQIYHPDGTPMTAEERFKFDREWIKQQKAQKEEDKERAKAWDKYQKKLTQKNSTNESNGKMTPVVSYGAVPTGAVPTGAVQQPAQQAAQQQPSWTQQSLQPHTNMLGDVESPNPEEEDPQQVWGELGYDPNKGPQYLQLNFPPEQPPAQSWTPQSPQQSQQSWTPQSAQSWTPQPPQQSPQPQQQQQLNPEVLKDWADKILGRNKYRKKTGADRSADKEAFMEAAELYQHHLQEPFQPRFLELSKSRCGNCKYGWKQTDRLTSHGNPIFEPCWCEEVVGENADKAKKRNMEKNKEKTQALDADLAHFRFKNYGDIKSIVCPTCNGKRVIPYRKPNCDACKDGVAPIPDLDGRPFYRTSDGKFDFGVHDECRACLGEEPCPQCEGAGVIEPVEPTDEQKDLVYREVDPFTRKKNYKKKLQRSKKNSTNCRRDPRRTCRCEPHRVSPVGSVGSSPIVGKDRQSQTVVCFFTPFRTIRRKCRTVPSRSSNRCW